jgi:hypothetical protein
MQNSVPTKDMDLFNRIREISKLIADRAPGKVRFRAVELYEVVPGEFYHGPLHLNTGLGNFFYFKSLNAGLFAVPTGARQPEPNYVFARFSVDWKPKGTKGSIQ